MIVVWSCVEGGTVNIFISHFFVKRLRLVCVGGRAVIWAVFRRMVQLDGGEEAGKRAGKRAWCSLTGGEEGVVFFDRRGCGYGRRRKRAWCSLSRISVLVRVSPGIDSSPYYN